MNKKLLEQLDRKDLISVTKLLINMPDIEDHVGSKLVKGILNGREVSKSNTAMLQLFPEIALANMAGLTRTSWLVNNEALTIAAKSASGTPLNYSDLVKLIHDGKIYKSGFGKVDVPHILSASHFPNLACFNQHLTAGLYDIDKGVSMRILDSFHKNWLRATKSEKESSKSAMFFRSMIATCPVEFMLRFKDQENFVDVFKFTSKDISAIVNDGRFKTSLYEWVLNYSSRVPDSDFEYVFSIVEQFKLELLDSALSGDGASKRESSAGTIITELSRKMTALHGILSSDDE